MEFHRFIHALHFLYITITSGTQTFDARGFGDIINQSYALWAIGVTVCIFSF